MTALAGGIQQIIYLLGDDQLDKYEYPIPSDEGGIETHIIWSEKPCKGAKTMVTAGHCLCAFLLSVLRQL